MRNRFAQFVIALSLLVSLVGCAGAPKPAATRDSADMASAPAAPAMESPSGVSNEISSDGFVDDTSRMIVRNASLELVVADAAAAMTSINGMVVGMGGYVTESNTWREGDLVRGQMTVRVPASDLDSAIANIKGLAVSVTTENVTGQDVTEEYTDLDAQLVNLEATENELRELLAQVRQNSQKAEEILQVYRELSSIRGEIDRVKGRMQYLDNLTTMATLHIGLTPDELAKPIVAAGWRPLETVRSAGRSLVSALEWLAGAVIWIVLYVIPLLILISLPFVLLFLLIRWLRRRSRAHREPK